MLLCIFDNEEGVECRWERGKDKVNGKTRKKGEEGEKRRKMVVMMTCTHR